MKTFNELISEINVVKGPESDLSIFWDDVETAIEQYGEDAEEHIRELADDIDYIVFVKVEDTDNSSTFSVTIAKSEDEMKRGENITHTFQHAK